MGLRIKVVNIGVSTYEFAPVRFVIQLDDGRMGYLDTKMSDTNIERQMLGDNTGFYSVFWTTDPQLKYHFSKEPWTAIRNHKVRLGMSKQVVILSWGEPGKINTSLYASGKEEQW